MLKVEDSEVSTENILDKPHDTEDNLLLETVLCNMRESTLSYQKQINYERKYKLHDIQTKLNELTSSINTDNMFEETKIIEGELIRLN